MSEFAAANDAYVRVFPTELPPARACVAVAGCGGTHAECLAIVPADDAAGRARKDLVGAMHVRSISLWAPANIGPYAQECHAAAFGGAASARGEHGCTVHHLSGMIGLDPGSMTLVPGGAAEEARRAVLSIDAVLRAVASRIERTVAVTAYVAAGDARGVDAAADAAVAAWREKQRDSDEEEEGGEADEASRDWGAALDPLVLVVDELPRAAAVEYHSMALSACASPDYSSSSSDEEREEEGDGPGACRAKLPVLRPVRVAIGDGLGGLAAARVAVWPSLDVRATVAIGSAAVVLGHDGDGNGHADAGLAGDAAARIASAVDAAIASMRARIPDRCSDPGDATLVTVFLPASLHASAGGSNSAAQIETALAASSSFQTESGQPSVQVTALPVRAVAHVDAAFAFEWTSFRPWATR